jgi:Flp pilus assembly pilin Flp
LIKKTFRNSENGQSMLEYALIILLMAGLTIAALWLLGGGVRDALARLFQPTPAGETPPFSEESPAPSGAADHFFIPLVDDFVDQALLDWQISKGNWLVKDGLFQSAGQGSLAWVKVPLPDYTYSLDLTTLKSGKKSADQVTQAVVRFQDEKNYYAIIPNQNGVIELAKMQNGVWYPSLAVAHVGVDPEKTNALQVKVSGSQVEVNLNGTLVIRYDDPSPIPSGGAGAVNNGSAGAIDHVKIEPNP